MTTRREVLGAVTAGALLPFVGARVQPVRAQTGLAPSVAPSLGAIRFVTITASDLAAVESAWTKFMAYRVNGRGRLSTQTVKSWGAPSLAGKRYVILGPASGEPTYLRFVEQPTPDGYDFPGTYGWNATEITVQNSVELYERLKDSPFKVRGPPRQVPTYPYLKAMGATGPAGERLNLTWITETRPDLAVAKSFVGRCFITVQSSPDLKGSLDFFRTTFGNTASPIRKLPSIDLSVVTLKDGAKIEIDQHKGEGRKRERVSVGLPAGLALVSFDCSSFNSVTDKFLSPPVKGEFEPFTGRHVGTMPGLAGELIELLET